MTIGGGPRGPAVLVIEPMGNAGRFLVEAAERLGLRLYAATHKDIHDGYPVWLRSALAGSRWDAHPWRQRERSV